jgi:uncharacterized tellurite resistance protein B-like protein
MSDRQDPRRELERRLLALGIEGRDYRVLMLLPLVYVAWADGKMDSVEVDRIRAVARDRLSLGPESESVVERWLKERPSRAQVEAGLTSLLDLATDEEVLDIDVSDLPDLVMHAEAIARATGAALNDDPMGVSSEENRALQEIADLLQVDSGETWGELLEELRSRVSSKIDGG